MVELFLSKPNQEDDDRASDFAKLIISHLNKLESLLWLLMTSGGRSEARLWLCNTISGINSISADQQRELFLNFLSSKQRNFDLVSQLLQMIFEKKQCRAGNVLAKNSYKLEKFFEGNPRRIMQWFSNFSDGSGLGHQKGAKALSKFAFVNRDICWEELVWKGKHGQSPAMVATKPHYFLDLDVQRTVENFLENVPEFWSSNEFAESVKDGQILFTDIKFFKDFFVDLMYKEDVGDVWEVVNEFLMEESFSSLCHHLLIILEEGDLCSFLKLLRKYVNARLEPKDFGCSFSWLEIILSRRSDCESIDQLLLLNAIINQRRRLLGFVHDDEYKQERAKIKDIGSQISSASRKVNNLALILKECLRLDTVEAIKLMALHSWVIYYRLSEECLTPESWESVFVSNEIQFHKSDKYTMILYDGLSEESGSDLDARSSTRIRHKKKKKKSNKKRKRNYNHDDDRYDNKLLDFDASNSGLNLQSKAVSWLLSTDGFSASWTSADLPEHLSKHCFSTWMKWLVAKWNNKA
ncbi:Glycine--tRNA ligase beta subunit [Melia azedarach]|uniref:Glycine--tRNA ligase beta subunit n=1 Tax=Melia azedarach TaxID=155640 RepID=A0ACC1Z3R3_MELAZ|nr:Glycine--tRNA ligase beta subunit [Melia azedarach]